MDIPAAWRKIDLGSLEGTLMVLGEPDVGKSTFSQYLYRRLCTALPQVAYLDGDPGQSVLGPPCTMTLAMAGSPGCSGGSNGPGADSGTTADLTAEGVEESITKGSVVDV
jgi:hypothetical protein